MVNKKKKKKIVFLIDTVNVFNLYAVYCSVSGVYVCECVSAIQPARISKHYFYGLNLNLGIFTLNTFISLNSWFWLIFLLLLFTFLNSSLVCWSVGLIVSVQLRSQSIEYNLQFKRIQPYFHIADLKSDIHT